MHHRPSWIRHCSAALLLFAASASHALTVIAPTFDELVASAEVVIRGVVTDIHSVTAETPQGSAIRTLVTLRVERALKGTPGSEVTLTLLGGKVGRRRLEVVGMPAFKVGDRQIVFVANNGRAICPLIAAGHGRYHIRRDPATRRDHVFRDNEAPLAATTQVASPLEQAGGASTAATPMTLESFESRISAALGRSENLIQP